MNRAFTRFCMMATMSLTSCQLMAQAPPPPLDNPLQDINQQLRDVFTPLSKPTPVMDYLYDMTGHVTDEKYWTHFSEDTSNSDTWYRLYWEHFYMAYDTTSISTDMDLYQNVVYEYQGDTIPIGILDISYYKFKSNALTTGDYFIFDTVNTTLTELLIVDPPGSSDHPYLYDTLFAAAPLFSLSRTRNITWVIDPQYIFFDPTNSDYYDPSGPYKLVINFGDGTGFHEFDPTIKSYHTSYYNDTYDNDEPLLTAQILVDDVPIKQSKSNVRLGKNEDHFELMPPFDEVGVYFGQGVSIRRACNSTPENRKILIYLEGVDMLDFIPRMNRRANEIYAEMLQNPRISNLSNFGYDIYVVDWANSRIDMRDNALWLVDFLDSLKAEVDNDHEFVIIGESMGGVIARYALCYMESANYTNPTYRPNANRRERKHNCRLMITLDSPHQGANIPLSVQLMYNQLFPLRSGFFGQPMFTRLLANQWDLFLYSMAAKQLLIKHVATKSGLGLYKEYSEHAERTSFLTSLANLGNYPQYCKKLALSNGAFNGERQTLAFEMAERTPNDRLIDLEMALYSRILGINVPILGADLELNTNPNGNGKVFQINAGTYHIKLKFYWFGVYITDDFNLQLNASEFANTEAYCVNAGGYFSTGLNALTNFIGNSTNSGFNLSDNYWILNWFAFSGGSDNSGCWNGSSHIGFRGFSGFNANISLCTDGFNFCFIPVQSALDYGVLGSVDLDTDFESELNANLNLLNTLTPFDVIVANGEDDALIGFSGFEQNRLNRNHLFIKYENQQRILDSAYSYRDCPANIYGHWINREIGDERMHLDNYDVERDGIYEATYELFVNQFNNPWYTYVGGATGSHPGFYSKSNFFRIRDNVTSDFRYDIPSHNPPTVVNYSFTPFSLQGTSPFNGSWTQNNSSPVVCQGCFDFALGKNETTDSKLPYVPEKESFVLIYPNPVTDRQLLISYRFKENNPITITVLDMLGKPIYSKNLVQEKSTNSSNTAIKFSNSISPGIYMVVVENGQERFTEKIIIQ